jgi:hypothetical protein
MNQPVLRLRHLLVAILTTTAFALCQVIGDGEIPEDSVVLNTLEVDLGDRTITYHRIETPDLKPQVEPSAVPEAVPTAISPQEKAEMDRVAALRQVNLQISATYFENLGSEVTIWTPSGQVRALSSINFLHFGALSEFEADGALYQTAFFVDRTDAPREPGQPAFPTAASGESRCLLLEAVPGADGAAAVAALEALHEWYDANQARLSADFAEAEAAAAQNPPANKDTVIYYFPISPEKPSQP